MYKDNMTMSHVPHSMEHDILFLISKGYSIKKVSGRGDHTPPPPPNSAGGWSVKFCDSAGGCSRKFCDSASGW